MGRVRGGGLPFGWTERSSRAQALRFAPEQGVKSENRRPQGPRGPAAVSLPARADEPVRRTFSLKLVGRERLAFDPRHIRWGRTEGVTVDLDQEKTQSIPVTATFAPRFLSAQPPPRTIAFRLAGASPATLTCTTQLGTSH